MGLGSCVKEAAWVNNAFLCFLLEPAPILTATCGHGERHRPREVASAVTVRLEAFSDLVFGFSLSLLATRLDVPARVEGGPPAAAWRHETRVVLEE